MGIALSLLGALALAAPAHAQFGAQQQPMGTPIAIPLRSLGSFVAANAVRQRNVNIVAIGSTAVGAFNNQIAVVGVTQGNFFNRQPAQTMYVPTSILGFVKQVNINRVEVNQTAVGGANTQVAEVAVDQSNAAFLPSTTRCFFAPAGAVGPLLQLNLNLAVVTQVAIGDGNTQVALVGVSQQNASGVQVPTQYAGGLVQLNKNVSVITQVATGTGNTQVATVNVGQSNGG
jgi:predicted amino acid-binding ACT domain protein